MRREILSLFNASKDNYRVVEDYSREVGSLGEERLVCGNDS
jgi:hypothetical protein